MIVFVVHHITPYYTKCKILGSVERILFTASYYAPPSRPEGPMRCCGTGNAGGCSSIYVLKLYALCVSTYDEVKV